MFSRIKTKIMCMLFIILAAIIGGNYFITNQVTRSALIDAFSAEAFATGQNLKIQVEGLISYGLVLENIVGFDELCSEVSEENTDIVFSGVIDLDGNLIFCSLDKYPETIETIPELYKLRMCAEKKMVEYEKDGIDYYGFIIPLENSDSEHIGSIILQYTSDSVRAELNRISGVNLTVSILMFTIAIILITVFLSVWVTRPIQILHRATTEIFNKGTASELEVNISSKDELGRLGSSFNLMVSKLRETTVSKDFVDNIITSMTESLIVLKLDNTIDLVNDATIQLFGYSEQELIQKKIQDIIISDDLFTEEFRDNLNEKNEHQSYDAYAITKEKKKVPIRMYCSFMRAEDKKEQYMVCTVRDITQLKETEKLMFEQANFDVLTKLPNRHYLERKMKEVILAKNRRGTCHTFMALDLDKFKVVNDVSGHHAGDQLLKHLSFMMKSTLREGDFLARVGGDEFSILLPNTSIEEGVEIGERICKLVRDFNFTWEDKMFTVGVSIGAVEVDESVRDIQWMLSAADRACYVCKDRGGNRVQVFNKMDKEFLDRHEEVNIISSISSALEKDKFFLLYQPICSCKADNTLWYEVLIRMLDDSGKVVSPGTFLSAAQRYHLMPDIDKWVIHHFLEHYEETLKSLGDEKEIRFNINLSGATINDKKFLSYVKKEFETYQVPPQIICFEITETCAVSNFVDASKFIKELKELGCNFALDDFGSGFSSFTYIKYLPVDYIKIDGSFVKEMHVNKIDYAMVSSINEIAHLLGKKTIGEFVENEEIFKCLQEIGVDYGQGYWLGKPGTLEYYSKK